MKARLARHGSTWFLFARDACGAGKTPELAHAALLAARRPTIEKIGKAPR